MHLENSIATIECLLEQDTPESLTYAALECRLAIELICYQRLKHFHKYISHDDLKKWTPAYVVKTLISEVDPYVDKTFSFSISASPLPDSVTPPSLEDYEAMDYVEVGTQVGFNANKLGSLWNALSRIALHIRLPQTSDDPIVRYGDFNNTKRKVQEALIEIKRIGKGSMIAGFPGEVISFQCRCGQQNKRKSEVLEDGKIINCINPDCKESYAFEEKDTLFARQTFRITCKKCDKNIEIPKRQVMALELNRPMCLPCPFCADEIYIQWQPYQAQRTK